MATQLSVSEASRALKVSMDAVYRLCQSGKLTAWKRYGKWVISSLAVEERIKSKLQRNGKNS
jgi:excisionase family DNA binding protein